MITYTFGSLCCETIPYLSSFTLQFSFHTLFSNLWLPPLPHPSILTLSWRPCLYFIEKVEAVKVDILNSRYFRYSCLPSCYCKWCTNLLKAKLWCASDPTPLRLLKDIVSVVFCIINCIWFFFFTWVITINVPKFFWPHISF